MRSLTALFHLALSAAAVYAAGGPGDNQGSITDHWDYIIVGAGPAGIILADRLSQSGKRTLLMEGGGPSYYVTNGREQPAWLSGTELSRVDVPGLYSSIFANGGHLLCGNATNAFGGCAVGGSGAINAGLFFQPPASDFDRYFPAGWKAADVAAAIQRLYKRLPGVTNTTSSDGVRYLQSGFDAARKWLVGGAGYREVDLNAEADSKSKVFGHPIYDYHNGQRGGPPTTYLQTALARPNFTLLTGVRVKRVARFSDLTTGVIANYNGKDTQFSLRNGCGRVILSGGALQSPQLLMMSGIGDPATLSQLSAAGRLDPQLPASWWLNNSAVGAGLFDNPNTFIELSSPDVDAYTYEYDNPIAADAAAYLKERKGPYTFAGQTSAFWDEITHADGSVAGLQGTIGPAGYQDYTDAHTITLNIYGTSGLQSSGRVVLDQNGVPGPDGDVYYSKPQDADDIATFIRGLFDALPASSLTPLNISPNATKDEIVQYITTWSPYARGQVNHWSSSCRFGTCVNTDTTVVGMKNLHVVDGSIVPPLTVNPQMGIMIAAEKASEFIINADCPAN